MFEFLTNVWRDGAANKAMLIAGAVILLGAIGGLIFVLVNRLRGGSLTGDEAFMKTEGGEPIHWSKDLLSIMVAFDPGYPDMYKSVYRAVASQINGFIGKDVLDTWGMDWAHPRLIASVDDVPIGHMYLSLADPSVDHKGGSNEFRYDTKTGELKACFIKVSPGLSDGPLLTATRHEVGHGLGLAHDELVHSVMHATSDKRAKDFTVADRKRIKKRYS